MNVIEPVDYDMLCDERYGIVKALVQQPAADDVPAALVGILAHVTDSARLGNWQGDRIAFGSAFHDVEHARGAAIGEAMERYCGNFIPEGLLPSSYAALAQAGANALDPASLVLYSDEQYRLQGFPFVPFTADLPILWARGQDMLTGAEVLVPASQVYINYHVGRLQAQPQTHFVMYSGIAAGRGRADAERAALEELLERDATMIWWMSGSPCERIELDALPELRALLSTRGDSAHVHYHLIRIPSAFDVPVIGALCHDTLHRTVSLGVACRADPLAAARKALIEGAQLRGFALGLLDPNGSVWTAMASGYLDPSVFRSYRADRRYAAAFASDFSDITDLGSQSQYYLDPDTHHHAQRILAPPRTVTLESLPSLTGNTRAGILELLRRRGLRAISVDVTTPDVALSGMRVVRVIVPGLYPNAPAAFPFLGGRRLYDEPAAMGWLAHPLQAAQLVRAPLPHS
jgi:ribosomal protein S12 methylthiotransferase accessory factor